MKTISKKPGIETRYIPHSQIKEIYGAMLHGMQVFCKDGSSWWVMSITTDANGIHGKFERAE